MPLKVIPADSKDAQRAVEIEDAAYGPNELSPYLFPGPHDETEVDSRTKKLVANLESSPFCRWMQAVMRTSPPRARRAWLPFPCGTSGTTRLPRKSIRVCVPLPPGDRVQTRKHVSFFLVACVTSGLKDWLVNHMFVSWFTYKSLCMYAHLYI